MAGGAPSNDDEMITGINVTPLVDVMLVLLIIFMVTATTIVKETIEIELPKAASGGETVGTTLAFVLDKDGKLFVDGAETTMDQARVAVREAVAKDKDAKAIISADKSCSHGQVVDVIDVVKTEGLTKFAINIEKIDGALPAATP